MLFMLSSRAGGNVSLTMVAYPPVRLVHVTVGIRAGDAPSGAGAAGGQERGWDDGKSGRSSRRIGAIMAAVAKRRSRRPGAKVNSFSPTHKLGRS
jgi:hypothetical protein